jgi:hypothetical protein
MPSPCSLRARSRQGCRPAGQEYRGVVCAAPWVRACRAPACGRRRRCGSDGANRQWLHREQAIPRWGLRTTRSAGGGLRRSPIGGASVSSLAAALRLHLKFPGRVHGRHAKIPRAIPCTILSAKPCSDPLQQSPATANRAAASLRQRSPKSANPPPWLRTFASTSPNRQRAFADSGTLANTVDHSRTLAHRDQSSSAVYVAHSADQWPRRSVICVAFVTAIARTRVPRARTCGRRRSPVPAAPSSAAAAVIHDRSRRRSSDGGPGSPPGCRRPVRAAPGAA